LSGNNDTIVISGGAGGGGLAGMAATAFATTYTSGTIYLSEQANITINTSVNGASQYFRFSVAAGGGGVTLSRWMPFGHPWLGIVTLQMGDGTQFFQPWDLPTELRFSYLIVPVSISVSSSSNSSHGGTLSFGVGIFTNNASTLSVLHSTSSAFVWTNTSSNSINYLHGLRNLIIPWTTTITGSNYWMGIWSRTSTAGANWVTLQNVGISVGTAGTGAFSGPFGSLSNATNQWAYGFGSYSISTAGLRSTAAVSDIRGTGAGMERYPLVVIFERSTI